MPYSGSDPNLTDLQAQITALTTRLNLVDGVGLDDPATGAIPLLTRALDGVRSTIKQSVLQMQQLYQDLLTAVSKYSQLWINKFGP